MDSEVKVALPVLLQKFVDSNKFIREQVHNALDALPRIVSVKTLIPALVVNLDPRKPALQGEVANMMLSCLSFSGHIISRDRKLIETLLPSLIGLLRDKSSDARLQSGRCLVGLRDLMGTSAFETWMQQNLKQAEVIEIENVVNDLEADGFKLTPELRLEVDRMTSTPSRRATKPSSKRNYTTPTGRSASRSASRNQNSISPTPRGSTPIDRISPASRDGRLQLLSQRMLSPNGRSVPHGRRSASPSPKYLNEDQHDVFGFLSSTKRSQTLTPSRNARDNSEECDGDDSYGKDKFRLLKRSLHRQKTSSRSGTRRDNPHASTSYGFPFVHSRSDETGYVSIMGRENSSGGGGYDNSSPTSGDSHYEPSPISNSRRNHSYGAFDNDNSSSSSYRSSGRTKTPNALLRLNTKLASQHGLTQTSRMRDSDTSLSNSDDYSSDTGCMNPISISYRTAERFRMDKHGSHEKLNFTSMGLFGPTAAVHRQQTISKPPLPCPSTLSTTPPSTSTNPPAWLMSDSALNSVSLGRRSADDDGDDLNPSYLALSKR